jgi:hypothetical protein
VKQILDDKYTFAFRPAEGGSYQRQCFWEVLYAFFPQSLPVVAATSVVPHSSMHQALYESLKGKKARSIPQELFETSSVSQLQVASDDIDLIRRVEEILPDQSASLSLKLLDETEARLEEATGQVLADFGIETDFVNWGSLGERTRSNADFLIPPTYSIPWRM